MSNLFIGTRRRRLKMEPRHRPLCGCSGKDEIAAELAGLLRPKAPRHAPRPFPAPPLRIGKTEVTDADDKVAKLVSWAIQL